MPQRVAAVMSFVVFAVCLIAGLDNPFGTAVGRALEAMLATLVIGLVVGWMGQKMIDENIQQRVKPVPDAEPAAADAVSKSDNKRAKNAAKKDEGKRAKQGR